MLETEFAKLQNVSLTIVNGVPIGVGVIPRLPAAPYLLVTSLLETPDGQLVPQIRGWTLTAFGPGHGADRSLGPYRLWSPKRMFNER